MCTLTFYICILGWFSLVCVCSLIKSRCWLNLLCSLVLTLSCPVLSCALLCSQRVNGAVCEYGLPAGLSAGAGEAVWDAEPSSGGGAEVMCRHPAPPPPQHAGNMEQPPHLFLPSLRTFSMEKCLGFTLDLSSLHVMFPWLPPSHLCGLAGWHQNLKPGGEKYLLSGF